jgi:hypothetical protein
MWFGRARRISVAEGNDGLVVLDDFEGELEEWQEAKGSKVIDDGGDEVGTVEEVYVWSQAEAVHLIRAEVEGQHVLIPADAITNVSEDGVEVEQSRNTILGSPEHDSDDVPDADTVRATFDYYGYPDQLSLGG